MLFQIESLKHSHKLEVAGVRLECTRSKGDVEREREALQGQMDGETIPYNTEEERTQVNRSTNPRHVSLGSTCHFL